MKNSKFPRGIAESNLLLIKHAKLQHRHFCITRAINRLHKIYNKKVNIFNVKKIGTKILLRIRRLKAEADLVTIEMTEVFDRYNEIMKDLQS